MVAKKQGKALEILVASLEKALAESANITVHAPMRLTDRTTGKLREHDVVLELNERHHSLLIAIECRDRSRPIGVNQIEGFWAKCQDTGISQGVIVSTAGFYNSARTKADHLGIRCLDIEEVETFDWLLASGIHARITHLLSHHWTFFTTEEGVVERNEFEIIDGNGNVITMAALTVNAQEQLSILLPQDREPIEEDEIKVKIPGSGLQLRNVISDEIVPVKFAVVKIRYSIKQELIPFQLVKYQDKDGEGNITDVAYADLKFGDEETRMMIVFKEGEGGKVVIIPNGSKNA